MYIVSVPYCDLEVKVNIDRKTEETFQLISLIYKTINLVSRHLKAIHQISHISMYMYDVSQCFKRGKI